MITKVINGLIISATIVITLILRSKLMTFGTESHRGFFCDDLSLRFPVKPQTVSTKVLIIASFLSSCILFSLTEYSVIKARQINKMTSVQLWKNLSLQIPSWIPNAGQNLLLCFLGSMATSILTDIGKGVLNWPRPNFIDFCKPNVTCDENNRLTYVSSFKCLKASEEELEDALSSFPSAHASFAAYIALFLVIYVQERFKNFSYSQRYDIFKQWG